MHGRCLADKREEATYVPPINRRLAGTFLAFGRLSKKQAVITETINLRAVLNLPQSTVHFISGVHGEYDTFDHILNNCSGVI